VQAYLSSRGAEGLSAASLALRVPAIRQFHKHLCAEGHRRDDPALPVEGPRRGQPLPRVLTVGDVGRLRERVAAARAT
jgi:integrase/recombinase XerD